MERWQVIQRLLGMFEAPDYLEIGVSHADTFHAVEAARKVAVDPAFKFDVDAARADPRNANATYHPIPSDDYFTGPLGADDRFDVIFIDGLHTFDQTLRDLLHAISRLKEGGAIVIDDVLPTSYGASLTDIAEMKKFERMGGGDGRAWMGDVYRLVFFIRDYLASWSYATTIGNHGVLVMWRQTRTHHMPILSVEQVARTEYKDAVFRTRAYNFAPMDEIASRFAAHRAR